MNHVGVGIVNKNGRKEEGNVLFNDTLSIFYLWLYCIGHMVKATTWATHFDQQQAIFYIHHPTDRIVHTNLFVAPVVEDWLD